jgi:hypothetical protein
MTIKSEGFPPVAVYEVGPQSRRSSRLSWRMLVIFNLAAVHLGLQACAPDWSVVRSSAGWQAEFPGHPEETTTVWKVGDATVNLPSRILFPPSNSVAAFFKPGVYAAGGGTFPSAVENRDLADRALRDFAARWCATGGVKITQQKVTWTDAGNAELRADLDNGRALQLRLIVSKKGLVAFALTMNRPAALGSPSDGRRFLQSLTVHGSS